jgi:hypothetical protein
MKEFLGPLEIIWDFPDSLLPDRYKVLRKVLIFCWRGMLIAIAAYFGAAAVYYEYFLWSVER